MSNPLGDTEHSQTQCGTQTEGRSLICDGVPLFFSSSRWKTPEVPKGYPVLPIGVGGCSGCCWMERDWMSCLVSWGLSLGGCAGWWDHHTVVVCCMFMGRRKKGRWQIFDTYRTTSGRSQDAWWVRPKRCVRSEGFQLSLYSTGYSNATWVGELLFNSKRLKQAPPPPTGTRRTVGHHLSIESFESSDCRRRLLG